jgi:hypothetical protein
MRIEIAALAALSLVAATSARANDSTGYIAVGGLVLTRSAHIEMRSEDLYVSKEEIRVRYRFFNKADADIETLVAFPIPDLPPRQDEEYSLPTTDPVNFLGFETKVDGKPVANGIEQRAEANGTDCTAQLKSLNIPLSPAQRGAAGQAGRGGHRARGGERFRRGLDRICGAQLDA